VSHANLLRVRHALMRSGATPRVLPDAARPRNGAQKQLPYVPAGTRWGKSPATQPLPYDIKHGEAAVTSHARL
jgi:hypothetical protein